MIYLKFRFDYILAFFLGLIECTNSRRCLFDFDTKILINKFKVQIKDPTSIVLESKTKNSEFGCP